MMPAAPPASAASSSGEWKTPGTGELWEPMDTGHLSTLGTRASWGPEHFEDWSSPEITYSLQAPCPQCRQLPGQEGKIMLGTQQIRTYTCTHTFVAKHSEQPLSFPFTTQVPKKLPICCRDVAGRKSGGCLPVPGVRTGPQQLWSQRSWAQHQSGQALCSPDEGKQRQVRTHTAE